MPGQRLCMLGLCLAFPLVGFSQEMKCVASDGATGDKFGLAIGIGGDHLLVGAMYDDDAGQTTGSAYIYNRNQGGSGAWGEVRKLGASDAAASSYFGQGVAISGDYAIVGAPFAYGSSGTVRRGAAYVFQRNQSGSDQWGEIKKLNTHTGVVNAFGWSVDIDGDYAIAGDYYDDTIGGFGSGCGSAHLFKRNSGGADNWGEIGVIFPSCFMNSHFGAAVAISADHAVIGAGAQYAEIWRRLASDPDVWGKAKTLTSGAANGFGLSVAIHGDYVLVGASLDDDMGTDAGAAYVFYRHQGGVDNWGQVIKLYGSDGEDNDGFGSSVSLSGDYAAVGTPGDDDLSSGAGAAYLFGRNEGGADNWGEITKITASDGAATDDFGHAIAIDGEDVVAGAPNDDDNGSESGSAYIYDWNALLPVELVSFSAVADGDAVVLTWTTATEIGNAGFELQHAQRDGEGLWQSIVFIEGHGTTTEPQSYAYRVEALPPGDHLFRLKQIDQDGGASFSEELNVSLSPLRLALQDAYPNPFNPTTTITYELPRSMQIDLRVVDVLGRERAVLASGIQAPGIHSVVFDASGLSAGIYFYRLWAGDGVEVRRMVVAE